MNSRPIVSDLDDHRRNEGQLGESPSIIKNPYKAEKPLISIVIPLYNEEFSIKNVIGRIPDHYSYEIIIVDDGSTDNSVKKVKEIKEKDIKIIQHDKNQGYGAAILTGFKHATGDVILTMDSDGQHNPEEIPNLIKPIINNQADFVVGSRYLGSSSYKIPFSTRVGEFFIAIFLKILYNQNIKNNQGGFRAFRNNIIKIFNNIQFTGMGFTTELLFKAAHQNLRIMEIPIFLNSREVGTSYVNLIRVLKSVSLCILIYCIKRFKLDRKRVFLKRFFQYFYDKIT
ncbi:MAG: glycosyltransferase family 2 protein [Candidatus Thorarchaeota archaeon]